MLGWSGLVVPVDHNDHNDVQVDDDTDDHDDSDEHDDSDDDDNDDDYGDNLFSHECQPCVDQLLVSLFWGQTFLDIDYDDNHVYGIVGTLVPLGQHGEQPRGRSQIWRSSIAIITQSYPQSIITKHLLAGVVNSPEVGVEMLKSNGKNVVQQSLC